MWVPPCHNVSVQIGLWWEHRFIGLFGRLGGRDGADALPGRSALRAPEFDNLTPWPIPVCFILGVLQSLGPFLFQIGSFLGHILRPTPYKVEPTSVLLRSFVSFV